MKRPGAALLGVVLTFTSPSAEAAELCATLDNLTTEARDSFIDRAATGTFDVDLPGNEDCTLSIQLGGAKALHCQWVFPFREAEARKTFQRMTGGIEACSRTSVVLDRDQRVNHPDSYDLRRFERSGMAIDVSLKDKGAQQQTFVFLRIGHKANP